VVNQQEYVPNWHMYPASGDVRGPGAILDAAGWSAWAPTASARKAA
jgi:hypothetical protein